MVTRSMAALARMVSRSIANFALATAFSAESPANWNILVMWATKRWRVVEILEKDNIADIESLVALSPEQLAGLEGITAEDILTLHKIIEEN